MPSKYDELNRHLEKNLREPSEVLGSYLSKIPGASLVGSFLPGIGDAMDANDLTTAVANKSTNPLDYLAVIPLIPNLNRLKKTVNDIKVKYGEDSWEYDFYNKSLKETIDKIKTKLDRPKLPKQLAKSYNREIGEEAQFLERMLLKVPDIEFSLNKKIVDTKDFDNYVTKVVKKASDGGYHYDDLHQGFLKGDYRQDFDLAGLENWENEFQRLTDEMGNVNTSPVKVALYENLQKTVAARQRSLAVLEKASHRMAKLEYQTSGYSAMKKRLIDKYPEKDIQQMYVKDLDALDMSSRLADMGDMSKVVKLRSKIQGDPL